MQQFPDPDYFFFFLKDVGVSKVGNALGFCRIEMGRDGRVFEGLG